MDKIYKKLLIVDGSYMLHRGLHQQNLFDLRSPNGERSGGIFQFLRSISAEIKKNGDYFPVVTWDAGLAKRRTDIDPYYKHADERSKEHEVLTPEQADSDYITQYRQQRNKLIEILSYVGIPSIRIVGWEGDDLITLVSRLSTNSRILTDDKDMLQLVSEDIEVRRPMANQLIKIDEFLSENNYDDIHDFVINKAIIGDGSDNIPGCCKGVSGGTSGTLIQIIKNINESDFNEDKMKEFCAKHNFKFRKAFLNFDRDRFNKNIGLVDLSLVENDSQVIDSIVSIIDGSRGAVNFFAAVKHISSLGIKEVSVDELLSNVSNRFDGIKINRRILNE